MKTKFLISALVCLFSVLAKAQIASPFVYTDASGHEYRRHVLIDKDDLSTLLLVIDEDLSPGQNQLPQEVVFRKRFSLSEITNLFTARDFYQNIEFAQKTLHAPARDEVPGKPLWEAQGVWDQAAEDGYNEWVKNSIDADYLIGSGIEVDCADLAILLHWVYARDHHLPVANSLAATGKLFGHFSANSKWDNLPTNADWKKDKRFIAGLKYMLNNSYTHSIAQDLYPTEINLTYVTPGSIDLYLRPGTGSGHTEVIKSFDNKQMKALMANEPAREDLWLVPAQIEHKDKAGFMRWRWPELNDKNVWVLRDPKKMPGYSLEQYQYPDMVDGEFQEWILGKVGIVLDDFDKAYNRLDALNDTVWRRHIMVDAGAYACFFQVCPPEVNEELSTPSLDKKLQDYLKNFLDVFAKLTDQQKESLKQNSYLSTVVFYNHIDQTPVLGDFVFSDAFSHLNSSASESIPHRWGFSDDSIMGLKIYENNFVRIMNTRNFMINRALYTCIYSECDHNDPEVKALNTSANDQRLKNILPIILKYVTDPADLKKFFGEEPPFQCPSQYGGKATCTYWDLMIGHPDWFQNMSPLPWDPIEKRYGIPL